MLLRVVDRRRSYPLGLRLQHLDLGPGRLDLLLGLSSDFHDFVPAAPVNAGPPPGAKVGTGDCGTCDGSHRDKVRTSETRQGGGGTLVRTLPHWGAHPPPLSYPGQPHPQDTATLLPPRSTHGRGTSRPQDRDGGTPGTDAIPQDSRDTEGS